MTRARDLAAFVSNADGDIKFDTDTLFIDSSANRVGIGTTTPSESLHIANANDAVALLESTGSDATDDANIQLKTTNGTFTIQNDRSIGTSGALTIAGNTSNNIVVDHDGGKVGIGTSSPSDTLDIERATGVVSLGLQSRDSSDTIINFGDNGDGDIGSINYAHNVDAMILTTNASEAMRIDSSGRLLVGKTGTSRTTVGFEARGDGFVRATADADKSLELVRKTSDGEVLEFFRDSSLRGEMGVFSDRVYLAVPGHGISLDASGNSVLPSTDSGNNQDNVVDLGASSARFDDVHATNGTIQTSDEREKQQIASLTDAEITAAKAISKLFKTFKWNDKVEAKGDNARTHTGVIAQQVETAMSDAGLDAGDYAFFISTTWWETQTEVAAVEAVDEQLDDDGNVIVEAREAKDAYTEVMTYYTQEAAPEGATERNRKGIRYPELLSFIGAATEQRLTSIEARLDALEA